MPSQYMSLLLYALAMSVAVRKRLCFKELVESRDEEKVGVELAACHREGRDSFHLKKMMELAFTGALLLFAAAAVATIQQQVSLPTAVCQLGNQPS